MSTIGRRGKWRKGRGLDSIACTCVCVCVGGRARGFGRLSVLSDVIELLPRFGGGGTSKTKNAFQSTNVYTHIGTRYKTVYKKREEKNYTEVSLLHPQLIFAMAVKLLDLSSLLTLPNGWSGSGGAGTSETRLSRTQKRDLLISRSPPPSTLSE